MEERPILVRPNTTVSITVGVASAATKLPEGGGRNVLLINRGAVDIAYNFGSSAATVALPTATAGGAIVPPGACMTVTTPEGSTHIATISGTAAQTLYVTTGDGG
jgi:hypothetical protein